MAQPLKGLKIEDTGALELDGIHVQILHFSAGWRAKKQGDSGVVKPAAAYPKREKGAWKLEGTFRTATGDSFALSQTLVREGKNAARYRATLTSEAGIATNFLALAIDLPTRRYANKTIQLGDKALVLPELFDEMALHSASDEESVVIPTATGVLEINGPVNVRIQDERRWGLDWYQMRLGFTQTTGVIQSSGIDVVFRHTPYATNPIDISDQANMAFADETNGDRKGGWTDQGKENDLRMLKPGRRQFGGVTFDILGADANNGRSCLVFSGPSRDYFLKDATVPARNARFDTLHLLHAIAWPPSEKVPVGTIEVQYADGTTGSIDVVYGRDVLNWWTPAGAENGTLVWTAENKEAYVGLFLSQFKVENKPIRALKLTGTGKAVWMVAGISGGEAVPDFTTDPPSYIVKSANWQPFEHKLDIEPGSVLDFSSLVDGPAGKYGPVVLREGHFEFERKPGERVRFFGPNLCFTANFQGKEACERLAERLQRMGYNTVRFHHYDGTVSDRRAAKSTTLDPAALDKIDYLFHCLKEKGIYISIDLYTIRRLKRGEIPELPEAEVYQEFKGLVPLLDSAMANWKEFSRNLLSHRNPYTGLTWAEDPALFSICTLNEDITYASWRRTAAVAALYETRFADWAKRRNVDMGDEDARSGAFMRFLTDLHIKAYEEEERFLKEELGVKALTSDVNNVNKVAQTLVRDRLQYVDNHKYWDHPSFLEQRWRLPAKYKNASAIGSDAEIPRIIMPARIFGKPYTVTEWNYCAPNHFRAEGGALMGAYAALQDWDGIYRFAYSHSSKNTQDESALGGFDIATDPVNLLSERIALLMFQRGDVKPARTAIPFAVTQKAADEPGAYAWSAGNYPEDYSRLGLAARIGSVALTDGRELPDSFPCAIGVRDVSAGKLAGRTLYKLPTKVEEGDPNPLKPLLDAKVVDPALIDTEKRVYTSETGEIRLDADAGTCRVVTARSECFVLPQKMRMQGDCVGVENAGGFAVVYVGSADGRPVRESSRLLVLHLTDVQNTKTKFRDEEHTILDSRGTLPHLVRRGAASIRIRLAAPENAKAWAIDLSGARRKEMPLARDANGVTLEASTVQKDGTFMAYEITTR
jgi:hypothetical protein